MTMGERRTAVTAGIGPNTEETIREGIRPLADIIGSFPELSRAVPALADMKPDLIFLDLTQNREQGIPALQKIVNQVPGARVFLLDPGTDPETILEGFRNGAADFIPPESGGPQILTLVRKALSRFEGKSHKGKVLTLFSLKGGQGVTSLALNLADQIRDLTKARVLLLDLNLFMGDITAYLDIAPDFTPFELAADMARMDEDLLFSSLFLHGSGLYILTTREEINDAEAVTDRDVSAMIEFLRDHFDFIVVDASHEFSRQTLEALVHTDILLTLAIQSIPSAKSVKRTLDFLRDIDFGPDALRIVLNRYLKKNEFTKADLERIFVRDISFVLDNDYRLMNRAAGKATFLRKAGSGDRLTRQIRAMAGSLAGVDPQAVTGWKDRLFRGRP